MSIAPESILITGHSGFVGRHLAPLCHERYPGARLFGVSHVPAAEPGELSSLQSLRADITDRAQVRAVLEAARPDLIFHLAGQASVGESWKRPDVTLAVNAGGALNLLEELHTLGLRPRVLLVGSSEQYGVVTPEDNPVREERPLHPVTPYAVSKAAQDMLGYQYFASYGIDVLRIRAFNHFGPWQPPAFVIASFARQIALIEAGRAESVVRVGNLEARRDFLAVGDVVRAYLALAERGRPGAAYNVGSGVATAIQAILDMLIAQATVPIRVEMDQTLLRPVDVPIVYADTSRLHADTGWEPALALPGALAATLDYWRGHV
ncbi:MAG TPA: GDP-mannose 4,6-dehydratase [Ktedonobacterales bacterium]|nr:GDP-mannose 4,6-dehydratase [Ktedonobacterales bacterium]